MPSLALSELIGAPVFDRSGESVGKVRELTVVPQDDTSRIANLVVKTRYGDRLLGTKLISSINGGVRICTVVTEWSPFGSGEGMLLLKRDLLDQQIIDVHGRKVVRVNDVDLDIEAGRQPPRPDSRRRRRRRARRGAPPAEGRRSRVALRALLEQIPPRMIPWEFVDLIETDPARRVKLKIAYEGLSQLHPADIADIVEDLAPAEREAVFETLDEEVAAEALEEIDPKLQVSIVESLDTDRAADIVEEMDPDAAADLLGDLPEKHSEEILEEMQPEERQEVDRAARVRRGHRGRPHDHGIHGAAAGDARGRRCHRDAARLRRRSRKHEHDLSDRRDEKLVGAVPLAKMAVASIRRHLSLSSAGAATSPAIPDADENEVAELFDKYNLLTLAGRR